MTEYVKLKPGQLDREMIVSRIPETIEVNWCESAFGLVVRLTPKDPDAAAWSGVTVHLEPHFPKLPDGTNQYEQEAWRIRIGWPACGAQDIKRTEDFIKVMTSAVLVARSIKFQFRLP